MTEASADLPSPLRFVFGDRIGLAIFLIGALFLGFTWRTGFFIVDSRTIANLVANVVDGRLAVVEAPYSLTAANQPGLVESNGRLYGRNYGVAYLAVPGTWLFRAVDGVLTLRVVLAGFWSLGLVALGRTASALIDRRWMAHAASLVALVTMTVSVLARAPVVALDDPAPLLGLQLTTILVAAYGGTVLYRLLASQRVLGAVAGIGLVLATPIGFWGSIPKRHVFTATCLLIVCLCFAASTNSSGRRRTPARGGAYAAVAILGTIHAFEAAFMFAVLVPIDLVTHRSAAPRDHAIVASILLVAALPMVATNIAIGGDPLTTPRMLPGADGSGPTLDGTTTRVATGAVAESSAGVSPPNPTNTAGTQSTGFWQLNLGPLDGLLGGVMWIGRYMLEAFTAGLSDLGQLSDLYHTVVRSGWVPGVDYAVNGWEAVELSLLEAVPLLGVLAAVPALTVTRIYLHSQPDSGGPTLRPVDGLALAMTVIFILVYLPLVPLHSMITLRYLVPAVPLAVYLACRLNPVREVVNHAQFTLVCATIGTVCLGGIGLLIGLPIIDPAVGEAVQLHALIGLGAGTALVGVTLTWPLHHRSHTLAVTLGIAAGVTMLFLLSAAFWHFRYAPLALDLARIVAEGLPTIG